jgi:DNA helicase HerA-like ATPase
MRVFTKTDHGMDVLASPRETCSRGDYLLVETQDKTGLLLQVYDEVYHNPQGIEEELMRDAILNLAGLTIDENSEPADSVGASVKDLRLLRCAIRGGVRDGLLTTSPVALPSRWRSTVRKINYSEVVRFLRPEGNKLIPLGATSCHSRFDVKAEQLDGKLNLILGRKGTGKSHLSKLIASGLARHGAYVFLFDLNEEYGGISRSRSLILEPGRNCQFTLEYVGLNVLLAVLNHALDTPSITMREVAKIWRTMEDYHSFSVKEFDLLVKQWRANEHVREALSSRVTLLLQSGLIGDDATLTIEEIFERFPEGAVIVFPIGTLDPVNRRIFVEMILAKLTQLERRRAIPPIFLFAEEAHIYLRDTYWEDLVTRMRHYGIFTTFITNQPDAIKETVYRQADNFFIFNFLNEADLDRISRVSAIDSVTLKALASSLNVGSCMVIGEASGVPITVTVDPLDSSPSGETRRFFLGELREMVRLNANRTSTKG